MTCCRIDSAKRKDLRCMSAEVVKSWTMIAKSSSRILEWRPSRIKWIFISKKKEIFRIIFQLPEYRARSAYECHVDLRDPKCDALKFTSEILISTANKGSAASSSDPRPKDLILTTRKRDCGRSLCFLYYFFFAGQALRNSTADIPFTTPKARSLANVGF